MSDMLAFLRMAIEKSRESAARGGFPAGAVLVKNGKIIGTGLSVGNTINDPTSHGEVAAIRDACKNLSTTDLAGAELYSSIQSCLMCHSALMWSGIAKAYYAIRKDSVAADYYGGTYQVSGTFLKPVEFVHVSELEGEALDVVRAWERSR